MRFADRADAGRQLATHLDHLRSPATVVVGLPRGGAVVAAEVAEHLGTPFDVLIVRKLGVPAQPELAMGAIGEGGIRVMNEAVIRHCRVTASEWEAVERREWDELERRVRAWRAGHPRIDLTGRQVVIVDDGLATGSSARAACRMARAAGAARVVLAVPVAPRGWTQDFGDEADELIALETPEPFIAVGRWYQHFEPTSDAEVAACLDRLRNGSGVQGSDSAGLAATDRELELDLPAATVGAHLTIPEGAVGVVVFAHGSGSGRHSPRNLHVAATLHRGGLGTLLFDLLTKEEAGDRRTVVDVELLAGRLAAAHEWLDAELGSPPVGYVGASTGAAAALVAAARPSADVRAVVSRGGRPDLAGSHLARVRAPTLLIVGGRDLDVLELNRRAAAELRCPHQIEIVQGAGHLFEEPGTLDVVADLARSWLLAHLAG